MTTRYTTNRSYPKPDFDAGSWHTQVWQALDMIDSDIGARTQFSNFIVAESWHNGVAYSINNTIVDSTDLSLWRCNVAHTSAGSGTFAQDRTTNPTYWTSVGITLRFRGAWTAATVYNILDHVYDTNEGISAICTTAHTSTASGIRADAVNWKFVVDIQTIFTDAQLGQLILGGQIYGG